MGTIFEQPARESQRLIKDEYIFFIERMQDVSATKKISFDQALKVAEILERRRTNDLYHVNGDVFDEQMCGLATLIKSFDETMSTISESLQLFSMSISIQEIPDLNVKEVFD